MTVGGVIARLAVMSRPWLRHRNLRHRRLRKPVVRRRLGWNVSGTGNVVRTGSYPVRTIRRGVIGSTGAFGALSPGSSPGGGAMGDAGLPPSQRYRRRRPCHRCPGASRVSARPAAVVVLAAGEGTRMKSADPQGPARDRRPHAGRPRASPPRGAGSRASRRRRRPRPRAGHAAPRRGRTRRHRGGQEQQHGTGHAVQLRAGERCRSSTASWSSRTATSRC